MQVTRRTVLAGFTAASYSRIRGANNRIQVGFIGYGLIGAQHVFDFHNQSDVDLVALSDCYQPRLEQGVARHAADLIWIGVRPTFDPLRNESRFKALLANLRLPNIQ